MLETASVCVPGDCIVSYKMMQKGVPKITSILLSKQELYHCSRISKEYEPKLSFASPVAAYSIRYWSCSVRLNTFDNKLFTICQVDFYHVRTHAVSNISLCCATHLTIVNKAQKTFLLVEKSPMYQRIFQDSNIILYMWISVRYYPMPKPFHATHTHILAIYTVNSLTGMCVRERKNIAFDYFASYE